MHLSAASCASCKNRQPSRQFHQIDCTGRRSTPWSRERARTIANHLRLASRGRSSASANGSSASTRGRFASRGEPFASACRLFASTRGRLPFRGEPSASARGRSASTRGGFASRGEPFASTCRLFASARGRLPSRGEPSARSHRPAIEPYPIAPPLPVRLPRGPARSMRHGW
jgi:hypothetical protein